MDKKEELEKLKKEMEEDESLPKYPGSTQLVFGEGNPNAEIYYLGEAPGFYEDQQGRPFVGQAGKLLDRLNAENGIKREDVYISNVVRYRPPNNRDPLPDEITAFGEYVAREIEIIKPKVIVTLGRFSMNKFLPGEFISRVHGRRRNVFLKGRDIMVIPMYHPAAALRNGAVMEQFREDFKAIPKVLEELKQKECQEEEEKNRPQQIDLI